MYSFFSLDGKEPKDQERLIARPRTRSALPAWVQTCRFGMPAVILRLFNNLFQMLLLSA
ncbi:MAG: hypothetical protein V5804_17355 [Mucilaginibacter sp.]|uniref:hypothetical protein n=1 Tax=Mucilaginibacter sp. TaxID=1882438 RepID=UPI0034E5E560